MVATDKTKIDNQDGQENKRINFRLLIENGPAFKSLKEDLVIASKLSLTGITNLVVNHEDPSLVDAFLKVCFKTKELYNNTIDIDAVELQQGSPGRGNSSKYIDELIFGTVEIENDNLSGVDIPTIKIDQQTGKRKRKPDGFVNRAAVKKQEFDDKYLIIKNIDYCLDFCKDQPGVIDSRALWIFDLFRNSTIRNGCRLILVTNKRIVLPFKIRTVEFPFVDDHEAKHIINNFLYLYRDHKYVINFSNSQMDQIIRKLSGLTYTEAGDALGYSLSRSEYPVASLKIDTTRVTKILRNKINQNFMEDGFGLTHLNSRPWEDYICPESSNFTFDVRKILRDFSEIKRLKLEQEKCIHATLPDDGPVKKIEAIQMRMPHIFVLYGKGGVGKCLGKGTPILMFNGNIKKAEDIMVGDLLMGPDSKPRTVLTITNGVGPLYRVCQNNGDSYVCNNKHILSLQNMQVSSDRVPIFISAEDFCKKSNHWKEYHAGWKIGVEFKEKNIPIDPYWMGLWLGDGTSAKPAITVGRKDPEIIRWLEKWTLDNSFLIRKEKGRGSDVLNFSIYKRGEPNGHKLNPIIKILKDLNVFKNKHIPEVYWNNSTKNRLALLAGLIDSDGYMTKTGSLQFTNTNKRLAKEVLYLVRSLGLKGFWSEGIKRIKKLNYKVKAYTVTIGGNLSRIPTKLPRKKGHDNPQKKTLKYGITVNPVGNGKYFGFTIDGDHQFLLGDFTVTHNSAFPIHFAGLLDFDVWDFNINACHSKWIGEGSQHMRETLKKITNATHLIVRVDEYDRAMGSTGESGSGMHEAHKQVESEFMNWLQNMQEENIFMKQNIFVVLTTNHKDNITGPLLRSGRADLVIDIDNFDAKSMKETFLTAARRMKNRGVKVIGYDNMDVLQKEIEKLDLNQLSELATIKGFTVRDIEALILEMAAHDYYKKMGQEGLEWNNGNFVLVLEKSQGSVRDDSTGELKLGDRYVLEDLKNPPTKDVSNQSEFPFSENGMNIYDPEKFKDIKAFRE